MPLHVYQRNVAGVQAVPARARKDRDDEPIYMRFYVLGCHGSQYRKILHVATLGKKIHGIVIVVIV